MQFAVALKPEDYFCPRLASEQQDGSLSDGPGKSTLGPRSTTREAPRIFFSISLSASIGEPILSVSMSTFTQSEARS